MPELPEIETIKTELSPWIIGQSFTEVCILDDRIVANGSAEHLQRDLVGQTVECLSRRGKYLLLRLSSGRSLIMHLRMTGSLLLDCREDEPYIRAAFLLSDGHRLVFRDPRRFGLIWLVDNADAVVGSLGPEPVDDAFGPATLRDKLVRRSIPMKAALLDQRIVAGIGNMYADEALFAARIHPMRRAKDLSAEELQTVCDCIRSVLVAAIACKGASVDTYLRPEGKPGTAHCEFRVAHRGGQACSACGDTIQRIPIQNRGSYFCPTCQPLVPQHPGASADGPLPSAGSDARPARH
jgi:formamidopyrimidine-DNA glycosylase